MRTPYTRSCAPKAPAFRGLQSAIRGACATSACWTSRAIASPSRRRSSKAMSTTQFFEACASGDAAEIGRLLDATPNLAYVADPTAPHGGFTGLHAAARNGHLA